MASWEQYPHLFDLELLESYIADNEVTIFIKGEPESYKKRFKEWRGIVSSVYSHLADGSVSAVVQFDNKRIIIDIFEGKNPTVQCYPFQHYVNWQTMCGGGADLSNVFGSKKTNEQPSPSYDKNCDWQSYQKEPPPSLIN